MTEPSLSQFLIIISHPSTVYLHKELGFALAVTS